MLSNSSVHSVSLKLPNMYNHLDCGAKLITIVLPSFLLFEFFQMMHNTFLVKCHNLIYYFDLQDLIYLSIVLTFFLGAF